MVALRPEGAGRRGARLILAALLPLTVHAVGAEGVDAQVEARPVLAGTVFLGDTVMTAGTVVLHHITSDTRVQPDSVHLSAGGDFSFELPGVPDPARGDIYFASVSHSDVLYFGPWITAVMDLDSVYEIHVYDTLVSGPAGAPVALEGRSIFFEPEGPDRWRVTDLFQLRNEAGRTAVALEGGHTWRYPLPAVASDVVAGEGEVSPDLATFEDGDLVVRAALPPGERLFVARYTVPSPYLTVPTPGLTEVIDILVAEPVPPLEIEGLAALDRVALEAGVTFRRYSAEGFELPELTINETEQVTPPSFEWMAVVLTVLLTGFGLLTLMRSSARSAAAGGVPDRQAVLMEIARLDETHAAVADPTRSQRKAYQRRRQELLDGLRRSP